MSGKSISIIAICLIVLLFILGIIPPGISCFTSVPAGYTGILTSYGKVESNNLENGIHWKMPYQRIVLMDNHVQTMKISAGTKNPTTSDTAETKDQQLIPTFEFEIQYQLNSEKAFEVYSQYGENYKDVVITNNAIQFIKETFAEFQADEIVTNKAVIPNKIKEKLEAVTVPLGINIIRINMVTYDFSEEYTAILEERALLNAQLENTELQQKNETIAAQTAYDVAVKQAQQEAETKRIASENENQIAIAKAEAKAKTDKIETDNKAYIIETEAEANKNARLAAAEAEKAELQAKTLYLNDYIIQQQFIEKWNGQLIPSFGSTTFSYANMTDIIKSYLMNGSEERE